MSPKMRLAIFIISLLLTFAIFLFFPYLNPSLPVKKAKQIFPTPAIVKAIYLTNYSAGSDNKIAEVIEMAQNNEINAVVIDLKDWSGYIFYDAKIPHVEQYQNKRILIKDLTGLVNKFHQNNIYAIARIVVFQDPVLAKARPDLAVQRRSKKPASWLDHRGLAWLDPSSQEVWGYHLALAQDALDHGFDEINFDYIRFPSDGNLSEMYFPIWNQKIPKTEVMETFFKYLRWKLPQARLSADLFGYATVNFDDLGIGQILENAFPYFDFICPMVYPSHYNPGFLDYESPALYPYQVIKHSMEVAQKRLNVFNQNQEKPVKAKLRPWLQDFDLGADYDTKMVKDEIRAVEQALKEDYNGFILWNAKNVYTRPALQPN